MRHMQFENSFEQEVKPQKTYEFAYSIQSDKVWIMYGDF